MALSTSSMTALAKSEELCARWMHIPSTWCNGYFFLPRELERKLAPG